MSSRRRNKSQQGRPFLRRRSTKWLVAAIITLAIGITLGVLAEDGEDAGVANATPTPTIGAPAEDR